MGAEGMEKLQTGDSRRGEIQEGAKAQSQSDRENPGS